MPRITIQRLTVEGVKRLCSPPRRPPKDPHFAGLDTLAAQVQHELRATPSSPATATLKYLNKLCRGGVTMSLSSLVAMDALYGCVVGRKLGGICGVIVRPHSYEISFLCSRHARCGSTLLTRVEKEAARSGRSLLFLSSVTGASSFYAARGYAPVMKDTDGLVVMVKYVKPRKCARCKPVPPGPLLDLHVKDPELRAPRASAEPRAEAWHRILDSIAHDMPRDVDLAGVALSPSQVAQLTRALASTTSVEFLGLDQCQLDDEAAHHLGELLSRNTTLEVLSVKHNHIQAAGASALAKAIRSNVDSRLEYVALDNNPMAVQDMQRVQRAVRQRLRAWT